jgi:hypothetical protein
MRFSTIVAAEPEIISSRSIFPENDATALVEIVTIFLVRRRG